LDVTVGDSNRNWKFMLADSSDMSPIGWLKSARSKKLSSIGLNKSGALSCVIKLSDDMATEVIGYDVVRCIIAYCDNSDGVPTARWSGPIWTSSIQMSSEDITINCVGWYDLLSHRELKFNSKFVDIDAGEIASRILSDANHTTYLVNLIENYSFEAGSAGWTESNCSTTENNDWSTTGGYSLTVTSSSTSEASVATDYIDVTVGSTYSCYIDFHTPSTNYGSTIRIRVKWYTSGLALISTDTLNYSGSVTSDLTDTISGTVTAPATAAYAIFSASHTDSSGKSVDFDNAIFVEGGTNGIVATPITIGDVTASQTREITFQAGTKHNVAIDTLVAMEAGFDWGIDPLTREMTIYYDNIVGTINGLGSNRTDVEFGYNWGPRNVADMNISVDSSILANRMSIKGKYHTGVAYDADSIASYGLHEDSVSLSDVVDADILTAYAGAETAYRLQPFKTYSFTPFPYDGSARIPRIFDEYGIGDIVYLTAKYKSVSVERQPVRVFDVSIDIDEYGNEKLGEIQTIAS